MTRRKCFFIPLAAAGCRRAARPLAEVLPPSLDGGWSLRETAPLAQEQAPAEARSLGLRASVRAAYWGPAPLTVDLFEMTTGPAAFELMQKWRPQPGRMAFYRDRYFGIVTAPTLDRGALSAGVQSVEKGLRLD